MKKSIKFLIFILLLGLQACGVEEKGNGMLDRGAEIVSNATAVLDDAVASLERNSQNFNSILQQAIDLVGDDNVKNKLEIARSSAMEIVTGTSSEVRCSAQFAVDFLVQRIKEIRAELVGGTPPPQKAVICSTSPEKLNMELRSSNRSAVTFSGYFLKKSFGRFRLLLYDVRGNKADVTRSMSLNSDFKIVVNLSRSGVTLNKSHRKLVLVDQSGNKLSTIEILQPEPKPCKRKTVPLGTSSLTVTPILKRFRPNYTQADREFKGNGPCTDIRVSLSLSPDRRKVLATVFVSMMECPDSFDRIIGDRTYGEAKVSQHEIAHVEDGWRIKEIHGPLKTSLQNVDKKTDAVERVDGNHPVRRYTIIGDLNGPDIGRSNVQITFANLSVTVEEIGDCISR